MQVPFYTAYRSGRCTFRCTDTDPAEAAACMGRNRAAPADLSDKACCSSQVVPAVQEAYCMDHTGYSAAAEHFHCAFPARQSFPRRNSSFRCYYC